MLDERDFRRDGYTFIDNARFLSMIAIVMRHCEIMLYDTSPGGRLEWLIVQGRTFGVHLFFVSSAFLMADWLVRKEGGARSYWKTRVQQVGVPWLVWVGIYVVVDLPRFLFRPHSPSETLAMRLFADVFYQSYWFVPMLFVSLGCFFLMRQYWASWKVGIGLTVVSLIHAIDLYEGWFPASHTLALFGYLLPLWVGVQLFRNIEYVEARIARCRWWLIIGLLCLCFCLTLLEDSLLSAMAVANTYNAMQLSNQLYACLILIVLLKVKVGLAPSFMDVRRDTYGIYLMHPVMAVVIRVCINAWVGANQAGETLFMRLPRVVQSPVYRIGLWFLMFAVVYGASFMLTRAVRASALAWIVGAPTTVVRWPASDGPMPAGRTI